MFYNSETFYKFHRKIAGTEPLCNLEPTTALKKALAQAFFCGFICQSFQGNIYIKQLWPTAFFNVLRLSLSYQGIISEYEIIP